MTQESLLWQWLAWLDTVPNEFLFLLALPLVVAAAGLLRLALDCPRSHDAAQPRQAAADLAGRPARQ